MVKNLRSLRISRGVSQQKIADYLGITQQSVNRYEKQKFEPDIGTLIMPADYFGTTVDYRRLLNSAGRNGRLSGTTGGWTGGRRRAYGWSLKTILKNKRTG